MEISSLLVSPIMFATVMFKTLTFPIITNNNAIVCTAAEPVYIMFRVINAAIFTIFELFPQKCCWNFYFIFNWYRLVVIVCLQSATSLMLSACVFLFLSFLIKSLRKNYLKKLTPQPTQLDLSILNVTNVIVLYVII